MPDMEKYDSTGCPKMYLRMYCNAMFQWGRDDRILVQMFPRILEKDGVKLFVGQDKRDVGTWRNLIRTFIDHFWFNLEMLFTREEIEGMYPYDNEGIRDYAY